MGNGSSWKLISFIVLVIGERKRVDLVRYKIPTSVMASSKDAHGTGLRSASAGGSHFNVAKPKWKENIEPVRPIWGSNMGKEMPWVWTIPPLQNSKLHLGVKTEYAL